MSLVDFEVWKRNFVPLSNDCGVMLFARQDQEVQSLYDQRRVWSSWRTSTMTVRRAASWFRGFCVGDNVGGYFITTFGKVIS
jgi:hypothetical protein